MSAVAGLLGADRFYLGRPFSGALKLLTLGGAGIWWIADMFSIAAGTSVNGHGHPMTGRTSHRLAAVAASAFLAVTAVSLTITPVMEAVPDPAVLVNRVRELATPPEPPAPPSWKPLTSLTGEASGETEAFTVTGNAVRYRYSISGPGYIYLLPAGTDILSEGAEPAVITDAEEARNVTVPLEPGRYIFAVQSGSTTWSFDVEQYDGDVEAGSGR